MLFMTTNYLQHIRDVCKLKLLPYFSFPGKFTPMELKHMQQAINRALSGDWKARDLLGIKDQEVVPVAKAVMPQTLRAEFKYASTQYFGGYAPGTEIIRKVGKKVTCTPMLDRRT